MRPSCCLSDSLVPVGVEPRFTGRKSAALTTEPRLVRGQTEVAEEIIHVNTSYHVKVVLLNKHEIYKILFDSPNKQSDSDPIPT